jgi:hypothetical protein
MKARSLPFLHCGCGRAPWPSSLARNHRSTAERWTHPAAADQLTLARLNRRGGAGDTDRTARIDARVFQVERPRQHPRHQLGAPVADLRVQLPLLAAVGLVGRGRAATGGVRQRHRLDQRALDVLPIVVVAAPVGRLGNRDGAVVVDVGDVVGCAGSTVVATASSDSSGRAAQTPLATRRYGPCRCRAPGSDRRSSRCPEWSRTGNDQMSACPSLSTSATIGISSAVPDVIGRANTVLPSGPL